MILTTIRLWPRVHQDITRKFWLLIGIFSEPLGRAPLFEV
ncbi:hypothetical protein HMPREF0501_01296 [Limosilactobacillus coleohominis 101-4-CHN]|uniref:Uncharacterized protein n=1 Tax=Limosilactobacillus coleohominis 101-4-CHN TaxID=575594 RepID=C7XX11_9LACO|nr:hypothetical protein HMPREF0501_01296 [Limosilactobacillus coleohominis 101-4-CHN]